MSFVKANIGGQTVTFANDEMKNNFIAARKEIIEKLNYEVNVTSSYRTEKQNAAAAAKAGVKSGGTHTRAESLDLTFGLTAFINGKANNPNPIALNRAAKAAEIMQKHGFTWLGSKDIVHFGYGPNAQKPPAGSSTQTIAQQASTSSEKPSETEIADPDKPFFEAMTAKTVNSINDLNGVISKLDVYKLRDKLIAHPKLTNLIKTAPSFEAS